MQNSLSVSRRRSRIFLYVIGHPFCSLKEIYEKSEASANWQDVKSDLDFFVKNNFIKKARWWSIHVHFVTQYLEPFERIMSNHLLLKDEIFSLMKSSEQIKNIVPYKKFVTYYNLGKNVIISKGMVEKRLMYYRQKLDSSEKPFEQILQKLIILYFLKIKILLLEYNKNKKFGYEYARNKKDSRERQIIIFLLNFKDFLSEFGKKPFFNSRVYSSYKELAEYLDETFDAEINYYNILSKGGLYTSELIKTYRQCILQTKKDTSEKLKLKMKQVGNRIKPIQKINGEPNYEKMCRAETVENALDITDGLSDIAELISIDSAKKIIRKIPKKRRGKLVHDMKILFPEISFDD